MVVKIETLTGKFQLGESLHWDVETQSLYFVDTVGKSIHKYVPATKKHTKATVGPKRVGFIAPVEGTKDNFLIGYELEFVVVTWDGVSNKVTKIETLAVIDEYPKNNSKEDPSESKLDNLIFEFNKGAFYRVEDNKVIKHLNDISIFPWNTHSKIVYYVDTPDRKVLKFDFDIDKGTISNQQVVFDFNNHNLPGIPNGQTLDTDGNLWVAVFSGSKVIKIDPRKPDILLQTVEIPASQIVSVTFGGPNLDELYVISSSLHVGGEDLPQPNGCLFKVTGLNVKGRPAARAKLSVAKSML